MNALPITSEPADLGSGYSVAFACDGTRLDVQWSPHLPPPHVGRILLPAYGVARNAFLAKVAAALGVNIMVVDAPAKGGARE